RIPLEVGVIYTNIFTRLGVNDIIHLPLTRRSDCNLPENVKNLERASAVFITGGNQVKLAGILGGTPFFQVLKQRVNKGLIYGGTSAGASIASGLMIAGGRGGYNPRRNLVKLTGGLGLVQNCIIDQHFRERNRLFRLASAVSSNPEFIGLGIDEDTALIITNDRFCRVVGNNSVTVLNGNGITHTGYTEGKAQDSIPIFGMNMNVVTPGYGYDLITRTPLMKSDIDSPQAIELEAV
ncbi:MAG TPA: cyanophycinase, partial [Candidatus Marinimicrobia bacterium]|nr:cyanophycinase [Candidatus Neomarinimicrobiota bacterium]